MLKKKQNKESPMQWHWSLFPWWQFTDLPVFYTWTTHLLYVLHKAGFHSLVCGCDCERWVGDGAREAMGWRGLAWFQNSHTPPAGEYYRLDSLYRFMLNISMDPDCELVAKLSTRSKDLYIELICFCMWTCVELSLQHQLAAGLIPIFVITRQRNMSIYTHISLFLLTGCTHQV